MATPARFAALTTTFAFALALLCAATAHAAGQTYGFLTHAVFFSSESGQHDVVDPQVFVADPTTKSGTGFQGIAHIAGYRPAFGVDDPAAPLFNAQGQPLKFTLGAWFGAHGSAIVAGNGANDRAELASSSLVPHGRYSLFENHFSAQGVTFTPLDGAGTANSLTANASGEGRISVTLHGTLTRAEAILLVYHSDGADHAMQRGAIGVSAHHQLLMRLPEASSSPAHAM